MSKQPTANVPEKVHYTKYYEHDGALRAYSNRMLWFGIFASLIALVLAMLFFYVRVQPPTVIRIAANGDATVVGGSMRPPGGPLSMVAALAASSKPGNETPSDIEGRAAVRKFLET